MTSDMWFEPAWSKDAGGWLKNEGKVRRGSVGSRIFDRAHFFSHTDLQFRIFYLKNAVSEFVENL